MAETLRPIAHVKVILTATRSHALMDAAGRLYRIGVRLGRGDAPTTSKRKRRMHNHYYDSNDLPRFAEIGKDAPALADKFFAWYNAVFAEGALTEREKSLIALAVAHAVQCPYCIDAYSGDCLAKGADTEQMTEAVHVAAAIRGGASLVHGIQMRNRAEALGM